jgi:predicted site-specific integrase-resolvase
MPKKNAGSGGTDDLITQADAAGLRGVDLRTLNQWVRRGRVRSELKYGKRLVNRADVMAYDPAANKGGRPKASAARKGGRK